ncbi:MAG: class II fructose-bisphosphate aldolase [Chloroflexota bacterium]
MVSGHLPAMLADARSGGYAVAAFNVVDALSMTAVMQAAASEASPVIVQTSAIVARRNGPRPLAATFHAAAALIDVRVALQLDHCSDLDLIRDCMDAGWDGVLFDGSAREPSENIRLTQLIVDEAHRCGVAVEGELEAIRGMEAGVASSSGQPRSLEESLAFIESTGIDAFAPFIGNVHGRTNVPVILDVERTRLLAGMSRVPLVLHGGTGTGEDVIRSLTAAGIAKINISTAIREAYLHAVRDYAATDVMGDDPVALFDRIERSISEVASRHMRWVGSVGQRSTPVESEVRV